MSWEPFDRWPGEGGHGAFRGASEPVLAQREGIGLAERLALFWRSSPDLPASRVVKRAALTSEWLYVERRDGTRERVARARLQGTRRDGPALVVGVLEGEDVFLPWRSKCPIVAALGTHLARGELVHWHARGPGLVFGVAGLAAFVALMRSYPYRVALVHLEQGLWTSESVLGTAAGVLAFAAAVAGLLWMPVRVVVDSTGVELRRGIVPWLPFRLAPEDVAHAGYRRVLDKQGAVTGYTVSLELAAPRRLGSLTRATYLPIGVVPTPKEADALADRALRLLGHPAASS